MSGDLKRTLCLAMAIMAPASGARAQEIDDRVRTRMIVEVFDDQGDRHKGRVASVTADLLRLSWAGGIDAIPADRIVRIGKPLRVGNTGLVIGAAAGASLGIAAGVRSRDNPIGPVIGAVILGGTTGLAGAGAGLLIDAIVHRRRTLYERPPAVIVSLVPIATSRRTGATVSITW
jgi:hypothetical protein